MDKKPFLTTPMAILIGSLVLAIALYAGGDKLSLNNIKGAQTVQSVDQQSSEGEIVKKLKAKAKFLGLDQKKFESCLDSGEKEALVKRDLTEGTSLGVTGTPAFFINGHLLAGLYPYEIFKQILDFEVSGGDWNKPTLEVQYLVDGNENNGEVSKEEVQVGLGDIPMVGQSSAPVTLVEFSDYECPVCARFYSEVSIKMKQEYIDTGKIKFYFRDFPLPPTFHQGAQKAAEAARCAGNQGKYWQYHDLIFANQIEIF